METLVASEENDLRIAGSDQKVSLTNPVFELPSLNVYWSRSGIFLGF